MDASKETLGKLARLIESAEASLKNAKQILAELDPNALSHTPSSSVPRSEGTAYESGDTQIVEGSFDGQQMIGPEAKNYPVPPNYASKSKLVSGDRLKLTILPNGSFLYKQIAPIEREFVKGTLLNEEGHFLVAANGKNYKVLLASVTYYKGSVGDEVTIIIPKDDHSQWAAIEAIIPQVGHNEFNESAAF